MSDSYLLDTGAANLVARRVPAIISRVRSATEAYVPIFALGELYFGAYLYAYKNNSTKYFEMYDDFRASYSSALLAPNADTAHFFAAIRAELRVKGQTIQDSDMWIAALARQYGLTVATTDAHYARISALRYEIWL